MCMVPHLQLFTVLTAEMIVLSDGHNVAPVHIEAKIKREIPFLSNVMLVGDGRDYLCCLVTLKVCTLSYRGNNPLHQKKIIAYFRVYDQLLPMDFMANHHALDHGYKNNSQLVPSYV